MRELGSEDCTGLHEISQTSTALWTSPYSWGACVPDLIPAPRPG